MRRRKLLVVLAGLAAMVAAGVVVLWPPQNRITQENFDRVREGMSRAEVEAILGPPGDYSTGPTNSFHPVSVISNDLRRVEIGPYAFDWRSDDLSVHVLFIDSRVVVADAYTNKLVAQSPLDNLLWRAKRQWHRWFPE
jgi:hypothetical protein